MIGGPLADIGRAALGTVTSRASIRTFMSSSAPGAEAAPRKPKSNRASGGSVSRIRRWSVQSPPFSTLEGTPGRGVIEPKAPPPPWNLKAVT
jgi:hypothetical protein